LEGRKKKKRKPMQNKWKPMKADRHVSKVNIPETIHQIKWSDFSRRFHTSLDGVTHINKHQLGASACIRGAARPQTMHHRTLTQLTKPSPGFRRPQFSTLYLLLTGQPSKNRE
jgi:hypothetical protein